MAMDLEHGIKSCCLPLIRALVLVEIFHMRKTAPVDFLVFYVVFSGCGLAIGEMLTVVFKKEFKTV